LRTVWQNCHICAILSNMWNNFLPFLQNNSWIAFVAVLWTLPWKGFALWKAAKSSQKLWFLVLFLVNTLGLLEIIYIFVISRKKPALSGEKTLTL